MEEVLSTSQFIGFGIGVYSGLSLFVDLDIACGNKTVCQRTKYNTRITESLIANLKTRMGDKFSFLTILNELCFNQISAACMGQIVS